VLPKDGVKLDQPEARLHAGQHGGRRIAKER
jgi:hypothetical protein